MNTTRNRYLAAFVVVVAVFGIAYYSSLEHTPPSPAGAIVWKSFDDGIALAGQSNKKLLIDVYTDWCSWCKKMDAEVYSDNRIVKAMNDHFVGVKLNAESNKMVTYKGKAMTESDLARQLGVTGYPTTVFFDEHSDPITSLPGYSPAGDFDGVLRYIGQDFYKSVSFQDFVSKSSAQR